mgnify:CR=1 FL=1
MREQDRLKREAEQRAAEQRREDLRRKEQKELADGQARRDRQRHKSGKL